MKFRESAASKLERYLRKMMSIHLLASPAGSTIWVAPRRSAADRSVSRAGGSNPRASGAIPRHANSMHGIPRCCHTPEAGELRGPANRYARKQSKRACAISTSVQRYRGSGTRMSEPEENDDDGGGRARPRSDGIRVRSSRRGVLETRVRARRAPDEERYMSVETGAGRASAARIMS